jgi:predicted small secreted protein
MKVLVALVFVLNLVACSTVAGVGKDLQGAAEWSHDKMTGEK